MIQGLYERSAGLDVHKMVIVATLLRMQANGQLDSQTREFSACQGGLEQLADWLEAAQVELVAMESTGVYWKSVYEALEARGLTVWVVNAYHVKNVPGRKTDVLDSQWLAELARCGLLRASFIPPKDLRELRLWTRYRQKLAGMLSAEKNRLHKILDDGGIRLGGVASDINGVSARRMINALIAGEEPAKIAELAVGRLRRKRSQLEEALHGHLSDRHRWLLRELQSHIEDLETRLSQLDDQVVAAMKPYETEWRRSQTIPGFDEISASILVVECGVDMAQFGKAARLSSWAGVCPGNHETAGKRKSGRSRPGNRYLRQVLCEAANSARKTHSQFKAMYEALVIRRGHKRAIMAIAHKLLEVYFVMNKKQEPYRDPTVNYEELMVKRNAPRWIKALQKYGLWPSHV